MFQDEILPSILSKMMSHEPFNKLSNKLIDNDIFVKNDFGTMHLTNTGEIIFSTIFLIITVLVYFVSRYIFSTFSKIYQGLKRKEKMFWDLAVVRGIFGFFGSSCCFYERFFDTELQTNIAKATTVQSSILIASCLGFFSFEVLAQITFDVMFKTFSKALHAHHFVSISGFLLTVYYDLGHYFPIWVFTLEMSTLFSCISFCLMKAKAVENFFWKINQLILIYVFHLRSVIEFTILYEIWYYWDLKKSMPFFWNFNLIFGLCLIAFVLTPYWTFRKTEQYFKKADWNDTESRKKSQ